MANFDETSSRRPSGLLCGVKRKYDPRSEVFDAAYSGHAVVLNELLQQMNSSERASALETKIEHSAWFLNFPLQLSVTDRRHHRNDFKLSGKSTPLIVAAGNGHIDCVKVLLKYKADIESRGDISYDGDAFGKCPACISPLLAASANGHVDVLRCLVENGADVNAFSTMYWLNENCNSLMAASFNGFINAVAFLIEQGADIGLTANSGRTALHYAVCCDQDTCNVLSCLIKNGADVNASTVSSLTPLMAASRLGHVNQAAFLIEHGANMDLQDNWRYTALHYAARVNSSEVAEKLLTLGASQLYNNKRLTPLLLASNECKISVVEELIKRPECTKQQRVDALELVGASLATSSDFPTGEGFEYMKQAMEERFQDPLHPLFKQTMEPDEDYQNQRESQTLEELACIEGDREAIVMEGLIIRERILGIDNMKLIDPITNFAVQKKVAGDYDVSIGLFRHVMKILLLCNQPYISFLNVQPYADVFYSMVENKLPLKQKDLLDIIGRVLTEYELHSEKAAGESLCDYLVHSVWRLLKIYVNFTDEPCNEDNNSCESALLQKLSRLNPRGYHGNTLLHLSANPQIVQDAPLPQFKEPCAKTTKLLLNAGINANVINDNGDTPLHIAVTYKPSSDKIHLLTDMLEVLLDGGTHHDFFNYDDKTAMDIAQTNEACEIISAKRKLELKCISARAVQKFGLHYVGVVPKILENYISRHSKLHTGSEFLLDRLHSLPI